MNISRYAAADLGFPRRRQPQRGCQPIILPNFPQKINENEENWAEKGDAHPKFYYVPVYSVFHRYKS